MRAGIGAFGYMALAHSLHLPDNLLQKKRVALVSHRNKQEEDYPTSLSRRCLLFLGPAVLSSWREPSLAVPSSSQFAPTTPNVLESITMPLLWNGAAYCIYYRVDGTLFRAVVDSGSPFLMIPGSCATVIRQRWGCYKYQGVSTDLEPSIEVYDGKEGLVTWRKANSFYFENATVGNALGYEQATPALQATLFQTHSNRFGASGLSFGVASESLIGSPGGIFLGLVKNRDARIRPTFLEQSKIVAFEFNFGGRSPMPEGRVGSDDVSVDDAPNGVRSLSNLTLYTIPRVLAKAGGDFIPLSRDLRKLGDPTQHYAAIASSLVVNGVTLVGSTGGGTSDIAAAIADPAKAAESICGPGYSQPCSSSSATSKPMLLGFTGDRRPIYAIIDTGVTGMVLDRELFNKRYAIARQRREANLWGRVTVSFRTHQRKTIELTANSPVTTPIAEIPWKNFKGHLVVIGLAFLEGCSLNVDIDEDRLWIEDLRQQRPDSPSYFIPKARVFNSRSGVA